jgi:hypothetical protein
MPLEPPTKASYEVLDITDSYPILRIITGMCCQCWKSKTICDYICGSTLCRVHGGKHKSKDNQVRKFPLHIPSILSKSILNAIIKQIGISDTHGP